MSFQTLSRDILKRHTEQYILQQKKTYINDDIEQTLKDEVGNIINKDEVGNIKDTWEDLQELSGVIQHRQYEKQRNRVLSITEAGEESTLRYYGYFNPTFELQTDALADYRVKFVRQHETLYLKILEYDPNNYLRSDHHHIVLGMERDRKYEGRQRGKKDPNIGLEAPDAIMSGEDVTITLNFPDDATGDIIVNNKYRISIENGSASLSIPDLPLGINNIVMQYLGDQQYNEKILSHEVLVKSFINIIASDITKYYHGPERLLVTVTDSHDKPISNVEISIIISNTVPSSADNFNYKRITKQDGTNSVGLNLSPGIYIAHITVEDQTIERNITIFPTIRYDENKIFNSSKEYFAIFLDGEGKYLPKNTDVQFRVNGIYYTRKVSTDDGVAFLGGNLKDGDYDILSHNLVTDELSTNSITIKKDDSIMIHASDMTMFVSERVDKKYVVTITTRSGVPIKNESVETHLIDKKRSFDETSILSTNSDGKINRSLRNCIYSGVYTLTIKVRDIVEERIVTVLDDY